MAMRLFDENFGRHRKNYLLQTGLAVALFVILLVERSVSQEAVIVAVAASTFIVFVVPNSVAAEPRRVVGGHLVGVLRDRLINLIWPGGCAWPRSLPKLGP